MYMQDGSPIPTPSTIENHARMLAQVSDSDEVKDICKMIEALARHLYPEDKP